MSFNINGFFKHLYVSCSSKLIFLYFMQTIDVLTAQNVRITYRIAGLGDRILAFIIDSLLVFAYIFTIFYSLIQLEVESTVPYIAAYIPVFFYHFLCEFFMNGQSIGKKQLNIRVVMLDGSRPSFSSYLVRWIMRLIDIPFYGIVAIFTILFSKKGQRLGDILAGTSVIKLTDTDRLSSNPLKQTFSDSHQVEFPEVSRLTDSDIDLIDKAIAFNKAQNDSGPMDLLAQKLKEKMGINCDWSTNNFLDRIKKDYHHLNSQG